MHQPTLEHVTYLFEHVFRRQLPLLERNRKQAEVPDVCTVLKNERGTAPGMWFGPSPTTTQKVEDGAKAPSQWEEDEESESLVEEETIGYRYADPSLYSLLKEFSIRHRFHPTQAENVLWELLKSKKLEGYKFRRQHIIDKFITDFVCLKHKLVIEIDGLVHQLPENKARDLARTEALTHLGFKVIRFSNETVLNETDTVLKEILSALRNPQEENSFSDLSSPTGGQGAVVISLTGVPHEMK